MGIIQTQVPQMRKYGTRDRWTPERRAAMGSMMNKFWNEQRRQELGERITKNTEVRHEFEGRVLEQAAFVDAENETDYTRSVYRVTDAGGQVIAFMRPEPKRGKQGYKVIVFRGMETLESLVLSPSYVARFLNLLWEECERKALATEIASLFGEKEEIGMGT